MMVLNLLDSYAILRKMNTNLPETITKMAYGGIVIQFSGNLFEYFTSDWMHFGSLF